MGFLLLQSRPGGDYLEAFSRPFNFCGNFGIGDREREKVSVYQSRLDLASLITPLPTCMGGLVLYSMMIYACWLAHSFLVARISLLTVVATTGHLVQGFFFFFWNLA